MENAIQPRSLFVYPEAHINIFLIVMRGHFHRQKQALSTASPQLVKVEM